MPTTNSFAAKLKDLLTTYGWSVADYANKIGVKVPSVRNVLTGKQRPPKTINPWLKPLKLAPTDHQLLLDLAAIAYLPAENQKRFTTLVEDSAHLRDIRGTMILADQVMRDQFSGKWIVAGTYGRVIHEGDELTINNLQLYLRLQVERTGHYPARIWCVDRVQAPNEAKLWDIGVNLHTGKEGLPVFEAHIILPGFTVRAPKPRAQREPGTLYALQNSLWLRVGNTEVASTPLDFIFPGPPLNKAAAIHNTIRNANDLQHVDLERYHLVKVKSRKDSFTLDGDHATVVPHDSAQAWNDRMDALGAERGTWEQLEAILPQV